VWTVYSLGDDGKPLAVREHLTRTDAEHVVAELETHTRGRTYWAEPDRPNRN
jgi:hypothetical protein